MGCWDCFCCFCSGPLENARERWIRFLTEDMAPEDWPDGSKIRERDSDGSVPAATLDEIVTISERDGAVWERCVCVTPEASESFVSPHCVVDPYGGAEIEGWSQDLNTGNDLFLLIHPVCLAFVCRHNSITPKQLWESFYGEGSHYQAYGGDLNGLMYCVDYYEMKERSGQDFRFAHWDTEGRECLNPESMKEVEWLLARPTYLPAPQQLQLVTTKAPSSRESRKVFELPELLDNILTYIVDMPVHVIESELKEDSQIFEAQSAVTTAKTLLSLAQVDRWFYQAIVGNRQDLFFRAIQNFGWMLPFCPADWSDSEWPDTILEDRTVLRGSNIDWRGYMLKCVNKMTPHIRNRWRLHKMAVQFARGTNAHKSEENPNWFWNAGRLAFKPDLQKPDAQGWEVGVRWW
ncbi:hypothetical protein FSARC_11595 [Fusarium sarcochroum]|uniref:Uncharacterized protein n=1 Tax=Fusarium sarcochroum TaxID=1208366 RepID=A0A8H4TEH6_9HYPO|nr:hypothetical protein FSARC_11595 [Fusarium sarcochroum]